MNLKVGVFNRVFPGPKGQNCRESAVQGVWSFGVSLSSCFSLHMVLEEFPVSGSVSLSVEEDLDLRGSRGD